MKKIFNILICCALAIFSLSCSKQKTLTDEELAQVFHDAFLANAFTLNEGIKMDSLRLYEPIFQKYGYTTEDVQYTIGNFALRKSSRLSDVVERAISMLEERGMMLDKEVAVLDTIDQIAVRKMTRIVKEDSLIRLRRMRDTNKTLIVLKNVSEGKYKLKFNYRIDSTDNMTTGYRTKLWSEREGNDERYSFTTILMQRNRAGAVYQRTINTDSLSSEIHIQLVNPSKSRNKKDTVSIDIRDLTIEYEPSKSEARRRLYDSLLNINIFDNELLFAPKDSL